MAQETMTCEERVWAAINLEKPDRVPLGPQLSPHAAAALTGRSQAQVYRDAHVALDAMLETFDAFGGWDVIHFPVPAMPLVFNLWAGIKTKVPGRDLPEDALFQLWEEEVLKPEDYDIIADVGWDKFVMQDVIFRITDMKAEELTKALEELDSVATRAASEWSKRGVFTTCWAADFHPFFKLSLCRSMVRFTEDLYYRPAMVEKALKRMVPETIQKLIDGSKKAGCKVAQLIEERAGGYFYPMHIFERFWWPYTMEIVDALWSEGIVTHFHLDTSWDKNIPYFRQLPRGSAIIMLDGTTDIFAAKDVLRGHLCIQGDVHPSLLSLGKPEEVKAYCKRLIDEVGGDGGFILGTGCDIPTVCKPENLRALVETGKTYELSKR